ncbi:MAG: hypothetical protein HY805_00250 [Nitrospirae bacterium]|nr:hypothetical protein [Nitrospirota bacterium]
MKSSKKKPALEEKMLRALLRQKRKYEIYLSSRADISKSDIAKENGKIKKGKKDENNEKAELDHKAEHAYTHIIKTIIELSRKLSLSEETDPEEMKRRAEEILESEFGIKRN